MLESGIALKVDHSSLWIWQVLGIVFVSFISYFFYKILKKIDVIVVIPLINFALLSDCIGAGDSERSTPETVIFEKHNPR